MWEKVRRIGLFLVLLIALMSLVVSPTFAAAPHPGPDPKVGPKGKKGAIMYLTAKIEDPAVQDPNLWQPDTTGAWAKLRHNQTGPTFDFTLNAYGLDTAAGTGYALIFKEVAWPDTWATNLGQGTVDARGGLTIKASAILDSPGAYSAWLWLVPCGDVYPSCSVSPATLSGWQLPTYLFAYEPVAFVVTAY